jgi:hypothetical protein
MSQMKWICFRRLVCLMSVMFFVGSVQALPVVIPDFVVDPSGPSFTIGPVSMFDAGSNNLIADPTLTFGVSSLPDFTPDTLQMSWEADVPDGEAQAGWELVFGADPDLTNQTISLDIQPPGGWVDPIGQPAPPGPPSTFVGILSAEVRALDNNGVLAGGWGFNTDRAGWVPLAQDPLALGLASLENNVQNSVIISVGTGPAAGSANVVNTQGAWIAPNYLVNGNNNWANILTLQFFENGVLQGGQTVIPGQTQPGLNNYWRNIKVTPEPASLTLLGACGLVLLTGRQKR